MPLDVHKVHVAIQYEIESSKNYPLIYNYNNQILTLQNFHNYGSSYQQ